MYRLQRTICDFMSGKLGNCLFAMCGELADAMFAFLSADLCNYVSCRYSPTESIKSICLRSRELADVMFASAL